MRCYHCDQPLAPGDRFCPHCGAPSGPPQPLACPQCHTPAPAGAAFCSSCGTALTARPPGPPPPAAAPPLPGRGMPDWGKIALGGAGGLMLGSLLGGHHGGFLGGGDHDEDWGGDD
jgi:hypothetical protein